METSVTLLQALLIGGLVMNMIGWRTLFLLTLQLLEKLVRAIEFLAATLLRFVQMRLHPFFANLHQRYRY
ncbi:hypothetical protein [Spirosoma harenae]